MAAVIDAETFEMFFKNLSPFFDTDEEFFLIIRQMTGLSDKKPSIQVKLARGKSGQTHVSAARFSARSPWVTLARYPSPNSLLAI
jgi:hypothetical protein